MQHNPHIFEQLYRSKYAPQPNVHHMSYHMTAGALGARGGMDPVPGTGGGISNVPSSGGSLFYLGGRGGMDPVPGTGGGIAPVPPSGGDAVRHLLVADEDKQRRKKVIRLKVPFTNVSLPQASHMEKHEHVAKDHVAKDHVAKDHMMKGPAGKEKDGHSVKIKKLMERFAQL